jgi:hypothetical protein
MVGDENDCCQAKRKNIKMKAIVCTEYGPPDVLQLR